MSERNSKFDELSDQFNENILAVKGTLELIDTSVEEDELHELLLKAIERMDVIQNLAGDTLLFLKNCFSKMDEMKNPPG
jgi:hypothetical protein